MKCIVTGGAGFIGSHLVESLVKHSHEVIVLDNFSTGRVENLGSIKDHIKIVECDISKYGSWASDFDQADWVFHLAASADIVPSIQHPELYFNSNVIGTFNVLQAAKLHLAKRFIYAASSSCYGIPDIYPTPEVASIKPQYPYALTKYIGEEMVLHWAQIYKLPAISLRFFNVYGTRSRTSGTYGAVFGVFLAQKIQNRPFTVVGDGNQSRDFTYVTDVVDAILLAVKSKISGEIFNVGSGNTISINRIVELLGGEKIYIPKRPGEPDITYADIRKISSSLKWIPKVNIETGVSLMINEIDYWRHAPLWTPEKIKEVTRDWFKYLS